MKKILFLITFVASMLTSCESSAQIMFEYDSMYGNGLNYEIIVRDGTPYYIDNVLSYYLYRGIYYYPYLWNGHYFFRPFREVQPNGFVFRPDMRHRPDYRFIGPRDRTNEHFQPMNRVRDRRNNMFDQRSIGNHGQMPNFRMPDRQPSNRQSVPFGGGNSRNSGPNRMGGRR